MQEAAEQTFVLFSHHLNCMGEESKIASIGGRRHPELM
jgi:hypothetical protein